MNLPADYPRTLHGPWTDQGKQVTALCGRVLRFRFRSGNVPD
jgi:hypothetical protein